MNIATKVPSYLVDTVAADLHDLVPRRGPADDGHVPTAYAERLGQRPDSSGAGRTLHSTSLHGDHQPGAARAVVPASDAGARGARPHPDQQPHGRHDIPVRPAQPIP